VTAGTGGASSAGAGSADAAVTPGLGAAGSADAGPADTGPAVIADVIRRILAAATGRAEMLDIPADAPLFGRAVALDSLTGTLLLREIRERFGVDVAGEDLNLDALATLGTLAAVVGERALGSPGEAR
jgi:acyl carrier protein